VKVVHKVVDIPQDGEDFIAEIVGILDGAKRKGQIVLNCIENVFHGSIDSIVWRTKSKTMTGRDNQPQNSWIPVGQEVVHVKATTACWSAGANIVDDSMHKVVCIDSGRAALLLKLHPSLSRSCSRDAKSDREFFGVVVGAFLPDPDANVCLSTLAICCFYVDGGLVEINRILCSNIANTEWLGVVPIDVTPRKVPQKERLVCGCRAALPRDSETILRTSDL
jgi:hypothetical protein